MSKGAINMDEVLAWMYAGTSCCRLTGADKGCAEWGGCAAMAMTDALKEEIRLVNEARGRGEEPDGGYEGLLKRAKERRPAMDPAPYRERHESLRGGK